MVPYNFLEKKAAYLNTGTWAKKALKEAKAFGETVEVASSEKEGYTYIPKDYEVPADVDYFHITTNNTIYGTELHADLDVNVPMVADMSSDIFSRPVDVSKYICIYGGAQKNLAPAGVTFVIEKNDALDLRVERHFDIGDAFGQHALPVVADARGDSLGLGCHLGVDLVDHGGQQAAFVAEVMIERPPRQTDAGGELVHRGRRIALLGKGPSGGGDQLGAVLLHRFQTPPCHHAHLNSHTPRI